MTLVLPNVGEGKALTAFLKSDQNFTLKLYVNNYTPIETSVAGSFTEMSTQGYAAKTLTDSSWVITEGAPSWGEYAQQIWTFDGTGGDTSVYGYYIVGASDGVLRWAERFPSAQVPVVVSSNGDQIKITPYFEQA